MRTVHKTASANFETADEGTFTALVSVFDVVDSDNEVVPKGAFSDSLAQKTAYPVVFSHQWLAGPPIGVLSSSEETEDGLLVKGRLFVGEDEHSQLARETWTAMKAGALNDWSFGASVVDEATAIHDGQTVKVLKKLALVEVGPCLHGANPYARTLAMKTEVAQETTEVAQEEVAQAATDGSMQENPPALLGNEQQEITPEQKRLVADLFLT